MASTLGKHCAQSLVEQFLPRLEAQLADQVLHPGVGFALAVPMRMEHAQNRFGDVEDLIRGQKLVEHGSRPAKRGSPAPHRDPEATLGAAAALTDSRAEAD